MFYVLNKKINTDDFGNVTPLGPKAFCHNKQSVTLSSNFQFSCDFYGASKTVTISVQSPSKKAFPRLCDPASWPGAIS